MDSSLGDCSQHPPATAVLGTSSPSPGWYQTAASPSKGKNRGRGRQKKARRESSTEEGSERTDPQAVRVASSRCQPSHQEHKPRTSPSPSHAPRRLDGRLQQQPRHLCRTLSPPSPPRGDCPVPPAASSPLEASLPFPSIAPSDRSRGGGVEGGERRPQTHAARDSRCNRAQTPSSRRRGADRTFRTVRRGWGGWGGEGRTASVQAWPFSVAHAGRGWHLLRRLWISSEWLAPPDFQAIAKHTRSRYRTTFSAATVPSNFPKSETTSHTVTAPPLSPLERPLLLPSPPLPLPPLRAPGIPRGTHALCDAAQPRGAAGRGRRRGERPGETGG